LAEIPGLAGAVRRLGVGERSSGPRPSGPASPAAIAAAVEFILEGLHLHRRVNKDRSAGGSIFRR